MQKIFDNELLTISIDPQKCCLYCSMRGFWQYDTDRADEVEHLFEQLSKQQGVQTVVLNTSAMRIMQAKVAEHFLSVFTKYMLDTKIKALAHVGDPDNTILRLQFQRVLSHVQHANEVRHDTFLRQQGAEEWLNTI